MGTNILYLPPSCLQLKVLSLKSYFERFTAISVTIDVARRRRARGAFFCFGLLFVASICGSGSSFSSTGISFSAGLIECLRSLSILNFGDLGTTGSNFLKNFLFLKVVLPDPSTLMMY